MLKSSMPVYLCSAACVVIMLSATFPHYYPDEPVKNVHFLVVDSVAVIPTESVKKAGISYTPPNKQGMKFVHRYLKSNDHTLGKVRRRSEIPFNIIDSIFSKYGLPLELKYVAVVESELKSTAVSHVGAKGPWQFMPGTAHIFGLKVNRHSDERVNYYKSTRAAARYLRDLYHQFGDWLLVLAAYNGGPRPVLKAIRKTHSRNFWVLQGKLPAESREYVKKFIATAYYFEKDGGKELLAKETPPPAKSPVLVPASKMPESADDKFRRLMNESAQSLQKSNELLDPNSLVAEAR